MRKILTLIIVVLFFSCSSENSNSDVPPTGENSSEVNLAIGIKKDADLNLVFKTLNELKFDIRQMSGFVYNSNTAESGVSNLMAELNKKPYIKTSGWSATPYTVYFNQTENKTMILNSYFEMNAANQTDLLNLISSLKWQDRLSEYKSITLSIPEGSQTYWKTKMMKYSFVKWTETFDQVCISYEHAPVLSANVPDSGNRNQVIPIPLIFVVHNGCGGFSAITETNSGNTKTITVKAKYEGCLCTQSIGNIQTTYNFTSTTTGIHTIKFLQPDGKFLTYSITIQ
ncbi:hypothetical protein [Flavobacterium sp. MDT1-60]|uniref:hypothetical protein n=1 Tax=Flavobacterium sp. MDT1-60 TaxID=1979344 RepID=UPI001783C48F|nr:hypothetical protein [Flavobacterium sp. MDT1-60]QOG04803.1 hypothetical protein IHE43_11675 [Flavobacterium sp. MDT1-60]